MEVVSPGEEYLLIHPYVFIKTSQILRVRWDVATVMSQVQGLADVTYLITGYFKTEKRDPTDNRLCKSRKGGLRLYRSCTQRKFHSNLPQKISWVGESRGLFYPPPGFDPHKKWWTHYPQGVGNGLGLQCKHPLTS